MPAQALYNRWRGQTFGDILGQEHITTTLRNQIRSGRIGHAYLFAGLRGTGKTSTARILAKAINCIGRTDDPPCNQCPICRSITEGRSLDLIEIDGASNRGIDEIRDLRDKVAFAPSECRYKVYVIDEVHMLTNEAFNALLKTLEEPPAHAVFILCTTEPHRLPATVLSRCQRFDFRRGRPSIILQKLRLICEREGIRIADDALELIARRATGSFRDAESLLDQLAAYGLEEITLEQVRSILGVAPLTLVGQLVRSALVGDTSMGLRLINQAMESGSEPHQFLADVLDYLRALMLMLAGSEEGLESFDEGTLDGMRRLLKEVPVSIDALVQVIKSFSEAGRGLRTVARPQLSLELAFIEAVCQVGQRAVAGEVPAVCLDVEREPNGQQAAQPVSMGGPVSPFTQGLKDRDAVGLAPEAVGVGASPERSPSQVEGFSRAGASASVAESADGVPAQEASGIGDVTEMKAGGPLEQSQQLTLDWVRGKWSQVLTRMRAIDPKLRAILNSARPIAVHGGTIMLGCEASFHRDRLVEDKRREVVERVLSEVMGMSCRIQCVVDKDQRESAKPSRASGSLFAPKDEQEEARRKLLEHPVVKELEKRGGRISKVSLVEEEREEDSGQQG